MLIVGIAGGTGSGKSTLAQALWQRLGEENAVLLEQDSYYVDYSHLPFTERQQMNYDHPNAFDTELLLSQLTSLKAGDPIEAPTYSFATYSRLPQKRVISPRPVILVEGLLVLGDAALRSMFDIKVFVDTDPDIRVFRRIMRDVTERGRTLESVHAQYLATVKPMHEAFVEPTKRYADFIVPIGGRNEVALSLLTSRLEHYLVETHDSHSL